MVAADCLEEGVDDVGQDGKESNKKQVAKYSLLGRCWKSWEGDSDTAQAGPQSRHCSPVPAPTSPAYAGRMLYSSRQLPRSTYSSSGLSQPSQDTSMDPMRTDGCRSASHCIHAVSHNATAPMSSCAPPLTRHAPSPAFLHMTMSGLYVSQRCLLFPMHLSCDMRLPRLASVFVPSLK